MRDRYQRPINYDGSIWRVAYSKETYDQYRTQGTATVTVPLTTGKSIEATLDPSGFQGAKRAWLSEMTGTELHVSISRDDPTDQETSLIKKGLGQEVDLTERTREVKVLVRFSEQDGQLPYTAEISQVEKTGEELRDELFQLNKVRLEHLAARAIQKGLTSEQFVITCIDVDDPAWTDLVDFLMPGADWQQYRDKGEKPVARGSVLAGISDYLSEVVPDIAPALNTTVDPSLVKTVVMGSGGASVYLIEPNFLN